MDLRNKKRLGDILMDVGKITKEQLDLALKLQSQNKERLGKVMLEQKMLTQQELIEVLELQLGIPYISLEKTFIDPVAVKLVPENIAKRHCIMPMEIVNNTINIAMEDPFNILAIDDVKLYSKLEVKPHIATEDDILSAISKYYGTQKVEKVAEDIKKEFNIIEKDDKEEEDIALEQVNNAPIVKLVSSIIEQAVKYSASDIHIEPFDDLVKVRLRIDGVLQETLTSPRQTHGAIVTRIKIMANLNIAERRIPQDGRVEINLNGKELDLRVSVLPTIYGEKVVIRLLDRSGFMATRDKMGFTPHNMKLFDSIIRNPHGIILVTGPTGSGKTTTLYTVLKEVNDPSKNIITIEDPVEYRLEGVNQVLLNLKAGLTFATGLRSILRQDPDIVMVGEIRDGETAEIAVRAAITGHLVLSTIHTNDAPSTVSRLVDMGIAPYLVSSSVVGIVAQRLVRKICPDCKTSYYPSKPDLEVLGNGYGYNTVIYKGKGCNACNHTGYKGRTAVHEIMIMTKEHRELIDKGGSVEEIRNLSLKNGMTTLKDNCAMLVKNGTTTIDELVRVAYSLD